VDEAAKNVAQERRSIDNHYISYVSKIEGQKTETANVIFRENCAL